jgi:single-strand DNA-binding protein
MSNDNILTFQGHVGTKVELRDGGGSPWVMFRAASTPSYWDQASRSWRDLETTWVSVKAWRTLAQNAAESLEVGDPIIAIGKLRTQTWTTREGESRESTVLEATVLAHDLSRGVTRFRRVDRQQVAAPTSDGTVEALAELESQAAESPAA